MAKITDKDIYQGKANPFDDAVKGGKILLAEMDKIIAKGKELSAVNIGEIKSNPKQQAEDYRKLSKNIEEVNTVNKNTIELEKQKVILEREISKTQQQNIKVEQEKLKLTTQQTKESERLVKAEQKQQRELQKQNSAYQKLNKSLGEARAKAKDIGVTYGVTSKEFKKAAGEVLNLDSKIKKIDKSLGLSQREVGNYSGAFKNATGALLGFATGALSLRAAFNVIKTGIKTFAEFEKQVSKVSAISGASATEIKALRSQAEFLGETTEKTASQVAQLQLELAKLGFNPEQIQNATSSILDLSTAVDADLGQSATVVGATLRAFGLDAAETARVTDVMALSFSRSSLDLNKFQIAMSTVAPVAKAFGFSIEETTSLLAQLTDAGFDASAAGTATRNILLNLADVNGDLAKRLGGSVNNIDDLLAGLSKLNDEGVDLNETLQLTDKRSVAAFNRFIEATDSTKKLTVELNNAGGSASRMANIMRDNLAGDTDKAKSAVEGLFINIGKRLNPSLRESTRGFAALVGKLNELTKIKASDEIRSEQVELNLLVSAIAGANTTQESRNSLLDELQNKYPDFLANLNKETISNEELRDRLIEVNNQYKEKINQLTQQELINESIEKGKDLKKEELDLIKRITELEQLRNEIGLIAFNKRREESQMLKVYNKNLFDNRKEQEALAEELQKDIDILNGLNVAEQNLNETIKESVKQTTSRKKAVADELTDYEKLLKNLQDLEKEKKKIDLNDEIRLFNKQTEIDLVKEQISAYEDFFKLFEEIDQNIDLEESLGFKNTDAVLGELEKLNKDSIDAIVERQKIIEGLESTHYDSLLSIFTSYKNRKLAEDKSLTNEEVEEGIQRNQKIETAVTELIGSLLNLYNQYTESRLRQLETEINNQNQAIDEQGAALDRQLELQREGAANSVKTETARLAELQKERDKNLQKQKELQKEQDRVNTLTQISAIVTSVANVIAGYSEIPIVGVLLGLAAAASLVTGFIATKSDAESAVSAEDGNLLMKKGNYIESGKRHSSGGNKYTSAEFEQGEYHAIFSRPKTAKYGDEISNFYHAIDSDNLDSYKQNISLLNSGGLTINNDYSNLLMEVKNTNTILQKQVFVKFDKNGKARFYNILGQAKEIHV